MITPGRLGYSFPIVLCGQAVSFGLSFVLFCFAFSKTKNNTLTFERSMELMKCYQKGQNRGTTKDKLNSVLFKP